MMECEIIPALDLTKDQWKQLGQSLARWSQRESGDTGHLQFLSRLTMANLANGEPPDPFVNQYLAMQDEKALSFQPRRLTPSEEQQRRNKLRQQLGQDCDRRTIYFQARGGAYGKRSSLIQSLRVELPEALVRDVLIDERSWEHLK